MKKSISFFNKLTGLALIASAMFWLSSCDEFKDNPTPAPTPEPSAVKKTATGAEVAAKSIVGITEALDQVEADIKAKAGKAYVLDVVGTLATTGDDNIITVPKVVGSDVELKFASPITTENALTVKPNETASTTSVESLDKLTITLPAGTEGVKLNLDMPETTVTLKAASGSVVFDEVVATTAINTLYIESGVTVKNIQVQGGTVVIKEGGAAETYVYAPADLKTVLYSFQNYVEDKLVGEGIAAPYVPEADMYQIVNEDKSPYLFSNLKVIKGDADYAKVQTPWNEDFAMEKITIADGAKIVFENNQPFVKAIEGEGSATISFRSNSWNDKKEVFNYAYLYYVQSIKNITIEEFKDPEIEGTLVQSTAYDVPANIENVTFKIGNVHFKDPKAATATVKNCKFEAPSKEKFISVNIPYQSESITSPKFNFESCEFADGCKINTYITSSKPKVDEKGNPVMITEYDWWDPENPNSVKWSQNFDDVPEAVKAAGKFDGSNVYNEETGEWEKVKGYWTYEYQAYEDVTFKDYFVYIIFKDCKYGDAALTAQTDFLNATWYPQSVYIRYDIDGKLYRALRDPENENKVILIPAE